MSTTLSSFCLISTNVSGTSSQVLIATSAATAAIFGSVQDVVQTSLSKAGYAKNGAVFLALAISTPVTLDFTSLGTGTTSNAGDTTFATVYQLIFNNLGTSVVTLSPGGSNPFDGPLGGTTPTFSIPAASSTVWSCPAGWAVSGTVKTLTVSSGSSTGSLTMCVGGA